MGRILFWLVIGVLAYALYRWWTVRQQLQRKGTSARSVPGGERMVQCDVCGLNVPRSEALTDGTRTYCCEEHRSRAGRRD
jgi:uncharacterized protein